MNDQRSPLRVTGVNRRKWCFVFLGCWLFIALLAPLIANHKPLYVKHNGRSFFPVLLSGSTYMAGDEAIDLEHTDWKNFRCEKIIFPPVAWSPSKPDYANAGYRTPSEPGTMQTEGGTSRELPRRFRHFLGTDKLGRDTLSGLIHGSRVSLPMALFSMLLASLIGISLGAVAGYFGDHTLRARRGTLCMTGVGLVIAFFYAFQSRAWILKDSLSHQGGSFAGQLLLSLLIFAAVAGIFFLAGKALSGLPGLKKQVYIKADSLISRLIEILISLPRLVLIIAVAAIARPSYLNLVLIIGLTAWTEIARLTRAEMLSLRSAGFIDSARALGFTSWRIIVRHALPNCLAPAAVAMAFGVASVVLVESSLSFLGAGVPPDTVTWGSMLAQGRENFSAWWLVVFPGAAIFMVVMLFNMMGEAMRESR